jgi:molybdopterin biosynthesis enzyme MoaB
MIFQARSWLNCSRSSAQKCTDKVIVSDEPEEISRALFIAHSDRGRRRPDRHNRRYGHSPRDNTPEATRAVIDREAPGVAEAMRRETSKNTPFRDAFTRYLRQPRPSAHRQSARFAEGGRRVP